MPSNQKGERHRASIKQKVILLEISEKLDAAQTAVVDNINFLLDVGQGRSQAIISYNQVLNFFEKANKEDDSLYKFRAITNHHGAVNKNDPNYNKNHCSSLPKMILSHVLLMQRNITYYTYLNGIILNT